MKRPLHKKLFYRIMRVIFRLSAIVIYRYRYFGAENFPKSGGGLVCSNHQSNLDPALVGITCPRHLNFLAKQSLFFFPLSIVIHLLDAIPIDRSGMGIAGIKETLKRARRGELILIFPEGSRTSDGDVKQLMSGFVTVARRSRVPLIPVGMAGAFEAWPRDRPFPVPGKVVVVVEPPIQPEEFVELDDEEVVQLLKSRINQGLDKARRFREQM